MFFLDLAPATIDILKKVAAVAALIAVVLSYAGSEFGWLDYKPGGAAFTVEIRPIVTGAFIVALLIALRWQMVGGILGALVAGALAAFAANQLVTTHAAAVVLSLLVPVALWVVIDLNEWSTSSGWLGASVVVLALGGGFVIGEQIYESLWGPTHPESQVVAVESPSIEWVWTGSVTSTAAEIRVRPKIDFERVDIQVSTSSELTNATTFDPLDASGRVLGFNLTELEPDTEYFYGISFDDELDLTRAGRFRTYPEGAASYTVAVGACARVGSNGRVFDAIRAQDPLLYLINGDLHYGDNGQDDDIERFRDVMDLTLALPAQAELYRSTSIAYMWDDHDYGGNDADGLSVSRQAAMAAYREYVPSFELSSQESAVYQAFSIGRVRYILTDVRSARNLDGGDVPSMLGSQQKQWFKDEILGAADEYELIVWVNPVPWIADARAGADHWGGFAEERAELANFIDANNIDNLLMVSGDAHMVAIDDGTNTNYSDTPGPSFPLLHAAALDRPGSVKGGPYSEGAIGGSGQFATLDIDDDGDVITVTMTARTWDDQVLLEYQFTTADS